MKIRGIDTFAGIGGFRIALQQACEELGFESEIVKSVEVDKNAAKTYQANFGEDPIGDMRKLDPSSLPEFDILMGGFPCQAFSRNGRIYNFANRDDGATLDNDDRSNLFLTLVGILDKKKPAAFVFENVKELKTIKNKDGSLFVDSIYSEVESVGYTILSTEIMDSKDFGIPQQRKRIYIIGVRNDLSKENSFGSGYVPPTKTTLKSSVGDFLESNVESKYLLENVWKNRTFPAKEKSIAELTSKLREMGKDSAADLIEKWVVQNNKTVLPRLEALKLFMATGEWLEPTKTCNKIVPLGIIYGDTPSGLPRQQDKLYSSKGVSPTIATFSTPSFDSVEGWRVLTPRECLRLQGFPKDFKTTGKDAVTYKQAGNAVTVTVAKNVILSLLRYLYVDATT